MYFEEHQTERLVIRPLTLEDAHLWVPYFENNPNLRFLGLTQGSNNLENAETWINRQLMRYQTNTFGMLALIDKQTTTMIGQCGLLVQEVDGKTIHEIGYHIIPSYWRQGYATEAAIFMKHLGFKMGVSDDLTSLIHIENIGSQKVARNNGMTCVNQTTFRELPIFVYKITKNEYYEATNKV